MHEVTVYIRVCHFYIVGLERSPPASGDWIVSGPHFVLEKTPRLTLLGVGGGYLLLRTPPRSPLLEAHWLGLGPPLAPTSYISCMVYSVCKIVNKLLVFLFAFLFFVCSAQTNHCTVRSTSLLFNRGNLIAA